MLVLGVAIALLGLGLCLRAQALATAEGAFHWYQGRQPELGKMEAMAAREEHGVVSLDPPGPGERGFPGERMQTIGIVLLVAGGAIAAAGASEGRRGARNSERPGQHGRDA